jgi:hypothetical protein
MRAFFEALSGVHQPAVPICATHLNKVYQSSATVATVAPFIDTNVSLDTFA